MLSPEVGKLPDPLDDAQWIVLRKNSNRTVLFIAARQHLLQPSRKHFIKEGIGNGLVDHARTRVKGGVDPVRTKDALANAVDRRCRDFSDAWRCRIELRALRLA